MRKSEIYEYCKLDDRNKNKGKGYALFDCGDYKEYCHNRNGVDHPEVVVGGFDHILGAGGFTDEHTARIVFFKDVVKLGNLIVDLVACHLVFRVYKHKLPVVALKHAFKIVGDYFLGNKRAYHAFHSQYIFNAVHLFHFLNHGADILIRGVGVHKYHVGGGHIKFLRKLAVGDHIGHIVGQAFADVVIDLAVGLAVSVICRDDENGKYNKEYRKYLNKSLCKFLCIGNDRAVPRFCQRLVENKYECGKHGDAADNAKKYALCHNKAKVKAKREGHKAQCDKSCNGGYGASENRGKGLVNGNGHCLLVVRDLFTLLVVAVPEEYRIVHCNGQL